MTMLLSKTTTWRRSSSACPYLVRAGGRFRRPLSNVAASALASSSPSFDSMVLTPDVESLVEEYSTKSPTPASLQTLMKTGRGEVTWKDVGGGVLQQQHRQHTASERILLQVAGFARKEIPIRLAHRIRDLDEAPIMRDMPSVQAVKKIYIDSFLELLQQPHHIYHLEEEEAFACKLEELYENHSDVLAMMARGAYELREAVQSGDIYGSYDQNGFSFDRMDECHHFLNRFYSSRIGIRVLAGQYLALRNPPLDNYVGLICLNASPYELVQHAARDATSLTRQQYNGVAPKIHITGRLDLTFPYIPTHLHYILLELLKNAMRATMETHPLGKLPQVTVIIADGTDFEDVAIKVSDEGGGIPRSQMSQIWNYLFTTADPDIQKQMIGNCSENSNAAPLAGLGFGLPLARSYARYFGGDLSLMSMEGHGTDAFVHLRRLGDKEPIVV